MLRYEPLQFSLGNSEYLLLPKLVPSQLGILSNRLSEAGFKITAGASLTARRPGQTIRINPAGICWSNRDPMDAVAPAIPDLLRARKRRTRIGAVRSAYFRSERVGERISIRFVLRIESGLLWTRLRRTGTCGIAPDEHSVASFVLSNGLGQCEMLTDYPLERCKVRVLGNMQYYTSSLSCSEAASTLRLAGRRQVRNSYLPEDGRVELDSVRHAARKQWVGLLRDLGEWCFLDPY